MSDTIMQKPMTLEVRIDQTSKKRLIDTTRKFDTEQELMNCIDDVGKCFASNFPPHLHYKIQKSIFVDEIPLIIIRNLSETENIKNSYIGGDTIKQLPLTCSLTSGFLSGILNLDLISYIDENEGSVFREVGPMFEDIKKGTATSQSGTSLNDHIDHHHRSLPLKSINNSTLSPGPSYLSLTCNYPDLNVPTQFKFVDEIVSRLSNKSKEVLSKNEYMHHSPNSVGNQTCNYHPILSGSDDSGWLMRFDAGYTFAKPNDTAGLIARNELLEVMKNDDLTFQLHLGAGDFVLWRNHSVLHSRGNINPSFDGLDRTYVRIFSLVKNIARVSAHPDIQWLLK